MCREGGERPVAATSVWEAAMQQERVKTIRNGEKAKPTFSRVEMDRRVATLRRHMEDARLDAALFTSIHNIAYFGDFVYCTFARKFGLLVSADRHVTIAPNVDGGLPWRRCLDDHLLYTDWRRDNFYHAVATQLVAIGAADGRVGVEYDHVSVDTLRMLQDALPEAELVDVGAAVMALRMIKSDEEIGLIREGARIADLGGGACRDAIGVGVSEHDVALHATEAMVREIARTYPDAPLMDTWTWLQSGINTDGGHNPVTTRAIQRGDILSLNCFPMINGYYAALERTLFCEEVSYAHLRLWEINCRVHRRGLELVRPGARCSDIARELNEIYAGHDLLRYRTFGYGHSFGIICHYYGREAALELREDVETRLQPGMVVSMEPMIMIPEGEAGAGGYREHDILVIGENGAENLTRFPLGPEHNVVGR